MFGGESLRLYFDVCCYSRPFDDLTQLKVRLEAEAVLAIMSLLQMREWLSEVLL